MSQRPGWYAPGLAEVPLSALEHHDYCPTPQGRRRLRQVAQICEGYGLRVQKSVFEIVCTDADLIKITASINNIIDPANDNSRIYPMHAGAFRSVKTLGIATALPDRDPLIL